MKKLIPMLLIILSFSLCKTSAMYNHRKSMKQHRRRQNKNAIYNHEYNHGYNHRRVTTQHRRRQKRRQNKKIYAKEDSVKKKIRKLRKKFTKSPVAQSYIVPYKYLKNPIRLILLFIICFVLASSSPSDYCSEERVKYFEDYIDLNYENNSGLRTKLLTAIEQYDSLDDLLVIFDFDETLITHSPMYKETVQVLKKDYFDDEDLESYMAISIKNHGVKRSHEDFPELVKQIQKKVKTVCLTASRIGPIGNRKNNIKDGYIESGEEFRIQQLNSLDLDFNGKLFDLEYPETQIFATENNENFAFHKGMLLTNHIRAIQEVYQDAITLLRGKGLVLYNFLTDLADRNDGWLPKKIIFVDDKRKYIEEVRNATIALAIDYLWLHYTEAIDESLKDRRRLSREQVDSQVQELTKNHIWSVD